MDRLGCTFCSCVQHMWGAWKRHAESKVTLIDSVWGLKHIPVVYKFHSSNLYHREAFFQRDAHLSWSLHKSCLPTGTQDPLWGTAGICIACKWFPHSASAISGGLYKLSCALSMGYSLIHFPYPRFLRLHSPLQNNKQWVASAGTVCFCSLLHCWKFNIITWCFEIRFLFRECKHRHMLYDVPGRIGQVDCIRLKLLLEQ